MQREASTIQRLRGLAARVLALTITVLTLGLVEVSWGGDDTTTGRQDDQSAQVVGPDHDAG